MVDVLEGANIQAEVGNPIVHLRCGLGFFQFSVWEGRINRETWDVLHSVETPALKDWVTTPYRCTMPIPFNDLFDNLGDEARYVVISSPVTHRLVLFCKTGPVPQALRYALQRRWTTMGLDPEENDHEGRGQGIRLAPEGPGSPGPRGDEGHRQGAGAELDEAVGQGDYEVRREPEAVAKRPGRLGARSQPASDAEIRYQDEILAMVEEMRADPLKACLSKNQIIFLARTKVLKSHGFKSSGAARPKGHKKINKKRRYRPKG
jgi:hypothetical protein